VREVEGSGRPAVPSREIGMDSESGRPHLAALARTSHLYMLGIWCGHGGSATNHPMDTPLAQYAADVEDVIDLLSLHNAVPRRKPRRHDRCVRGSAQRHALPAYVFIDPSPTGGPIRFPDVWRTSSDSNTSDPQHSPRT